MKTRKQKEAEDAVEHLKSKLGYTPTYEEVADFLGISKSSAYQRLRLYREQMHYRVEPLPWVKKKSTKKKKRK